LEESRSSLFWKNPEAHCFGRIRKLTVLEESGSSLLWKNVEAHCFGRIQKLTILEESRSSLFSLFFVFSVSKTTVQNSGNSELPNASK
jgi:hypothetical protein